MDKRPKTNQTTRNGEHFIEEKPRKTRLNYAKLNVKEKRRETGKREWRTEKGEA